MAPFSGVFHCRVDCLVGAAVALAGRLLTGNQSICLFAAL